MPTAALSSDFVTQGAPSLFTSTAKPISPKKGKGVGLHHQARPAPTAKEGNISGVHSLNKQLQHRNGELRPSQGRCTPNGRCVLTAQCIYLVLSEEGVKQKGLRYIRGFLVLPSIVHFAKKYVCMSLHPYTLTLTPISHSTLSTN